MRLLSKLYNHHREVAVEVVVRSKRSKNNWSKTLHWDEMADGSCGRRPPRPRPKLPTAISSGPKLLSRPFQTNDITWAQTSNPVSYGRCISLTIYILKFKFKAQIMNFTVIHRGHASCSHHVRTLYAHAVSFSITHLLHNAHCTRALPFAPFPHMLT